jgi:hypothetical protein
LGETSHWWHGALYFSKYENIISMFENTLDIDIGVLYPNI